MGAEVVWSQAQVHIRSRSHPFDFPIAPVSIQFNSPFTTPFIASSKVITLFGVYVYRGERCFNNFMCIFGFYLTLFENARYRSVHQFIKAFRMRYTHQKRDSFAYAYPLTTKNNKTSRIFAVHPTLRNDVFDRSVRPRCAKPVSMGLCGRRGTP